MDNAIPYPTVGLSQIIVLIAFLGALGILWLFVQRNKDGLSRKVGRGRRIQVVEVTSLSPIDRAMILQVDGQEYLVLRSRGAAPVLTPISGATS